MRPLYRLCIGYLTIAQVISTEVSPRWGQATVVINDALFVHGGKTDPYNSYGYTSAPNDNAILYLSLSSSFSTSSPPWQVLSNASSDSSSGTDPALSWHTLSAFDSTHLLLFGGEPGPNSPTVLPDLADSAYLVDLGTQLEPSWILEPVTPVGEPVRRIHHSATTTSTGNIYVIGGEKADDSGIAFSEHYIFDPKVVSFTLLPSDNAPPTITGHVSVVLPDGRLLVFGGYSSASDRLLPFSTIWTLDTSQPSPFWSMTSASNASLPSPRRAFAATIISNGKVLIHGGSDATLQNNFEDGWILDPSQDPMVWTQVKELSQLGALRDHFAVSSGDQVIFSFGYGNDKPSPAPMWIFNTNTDTFETVFTPPSIPSSQTQTISSANLPRPTSPSVALPTKTAGPDPGDPNNDGGIIDGSNKHKTIGIIVGSVLGLLSLVVVAIAVTYYIRRHHSANGGRHFQALEGTNEYPDDESEHLSGGISAAGGRSFGSRHGWDFGVFDPTGLAATFGFATRTPRHVLERKDMLADEDTRDFGPWYNDRDLDRESVVDHAWSLRSLIPSLKRSREPSLAGSMADISRREMSDPFVDDTALMREEEANHTGTPGQHKRVEQSHTSYKSYHDPFADPNRGDVYDDHDESDRISNQPYLHPIPHQLSTLGTLFPVPKSIHPLTPVTEDSSHTSTHNHTYNSISSHATSHNNPFDTISSGTSHSSFDPPPKSLLPLSSAVGVKRNQSWWSFAKTKYLDRRSSGTSKKTVDFRDPNPRPRLEAIEESGRAALVDPQRDSAELAPSTEVARHISILQAGHNKSHSSVRTADTEAIEKMAQTMDVAHLMRSDSRHTTSTSTTNLSLDTSSIQWPYERRGVDMDPEQTFMSSVTMADGETLSPKSTLSSVVSPSSYLKHGPLSSGAVIARIQGFQRRGSSDSEPSTLQLEHQLHLRSERANRQPVNYGLIPRANLFVVNPDHRSGSSGDTLSFVN